MLCARKTQTNPSYGWISVEVQVCIVSSPSLLWLWRSPVDVGHNIEMMDKHYPISSFDKVYLIDLCEPLLQVARKRFAKRGWNNVVVLCQDASEFSLPEWGNGVDPKGSVGFITMSYSLSMVRVLFLSWHSI